MKSNENAKLEILYNQQKKSVFIAYVVGFFFGGIGGHYFYLGKTGYGVAMLAIFALTMFIGGFMYTVLGLAVLWGAIHTALLTEKVNKDIKNSVNILYGEDK